MGKGETVQEGETQNTQMVGNRDNENRENEKKKKGGNKGKWMRKKTKRPGVGLDVKYPTLGTRTLD